MSFNLVSEPWIPVSFVEGHVGEVSLTRLFSEAHRIRRISCALPTQSFAILRVALAIVHDAIGFHTIDEIVDAAQDGLDTEVILAYLEQWQDRFDLFHPGRPFMQVSTLRTSKGEVAGLEKLISDVPNGEPFLTTRGGLGLGVITPAEAAQWLIHAQAFDPSGIRSGAVGDALVKGGKGYPIGPAWVGQIGGIVLHGSNLSQTLIYNLAPTAPNPDDRPVWTLSDPQTEQRSEDPAVPGPVSVLTWQPRRIRLAGGPEGVTGVVLSQGDKMTPQNRHTVEFMTSWRFSEPQTKKHGIPVYMPYKHDPERAGWRGAPHLIQKSDEVTNGQARTLPAQTVEQLAVVQAESEGHRHVRLELVGMDYGPQEATVAELVHDTLDFRASLFGDEGAEVRAMLNDEIAKADTCVWALGRLAGNIAQAAGDFDGVTGAQARARLIAWSALDAPARDWMAGLAADTDVLVARRQWAQTLRVVLGAEAARLVNGCSPAAITGRKTKHGWMTAAKAEAFFHKALRNELPLAFEERPKESEA